MRIRAKTAFFVDSLTLPDALFQTGSKNLSGGTAASPQSLPSKASGNINRDDCTCKEARRKADDTASINICFLLTSRSTKARMLSWQIIA